MKHHQQGMNLTELLIALLISSFIMMGLMHHYLNTKKQYDDVQKAIELNIDLQMIIDLIRNSIRLAGFTPCLNVEYLTTVDLRDKTNKLVALQYDMKDGSWLKISRMSEYFDTVIKIINPTQLISTNQRRFHQGKSILIADCYHGEVQTIDQVIHTSKEELITLKTPILFSYHEPIYIGEWIEEIYSVRTRHNGNKSLFYQQQHAEELTTAVQEFSVRLKNNQGKIILQVLLGLNLDRTVKLETLVRSL